MNHYPLAEGLNVKVSIPKTIEVRMVDASALADYEMWFFIASVLANAVMGFGVAYFQDRTATHLLSTALVFLVLFIASATFAFYKRYRLRQRSKAITLRASELVDPEEGG